MIGGFSQTCQGPTRAELLPQRMLDTAQRRPVRREPRPSWCCVRPAGAGTDRSLMRSLTSSGHQVKARVAGDCSVAGCLADRLKRWVAAPCKMQSYMDGDTSRLVHLCIVNGEL
ncbi:hypothetical protein E2C01_092709 [Portunus trituberculatus]|uniref:Uncharacterized protein n=1 Tax=Portunus trituberculatus TaxID=210409 RepID=A0A5B7JS51_PORTR|nr:hypothetical protein [Portunus trituberculatus]